MPTPKSPLEESYVFAVAAMLAMIHNGSSRAARDVNLYMPGVGGLRLRSMVWRITNPRQYAHVVARMCRVPRP